MSSFDDALRRQETKQQALNAQQQSADDYRRRAAEAAVPRVVQMLQDFARTLNARGVRPQRIEVQVRRGLHLAKHSPDGYPLFLYYQFSQKYVGYLSIVTPDGRLWYYSSHRPRESGFVQIDAGLLLQRSSALMEAAVQQDGRIGSVDRDRRFTPLEDLLAAQAQRLLVGSGR